MPIKEASLFKVVEKIGNHYRTNIDNRFMRNTLARLELQRGDRDHIDVIANLPDYVRMQGFEFYDLYEKILALARFTGQVQREVLPMLPKASSRSGGTQEEILRNMALSTYAANVNILVDMVQELYITTVDLDKRENGANPVYRQIPELQNIGNLLVNRSS